VLFKDLQKLVSHSQREHTTKELFHRLHNKPFWIWDIEEHKQEDIRTDGDCCFNHIIGLPQKDGIDKPLFDYEGIIFDYLVTRDGNNNNNTSSYGKHLWIKKATGLGISEFMLRFMAWLCLKDNALVLLDEADFFPPGQQQAARDVSERYIAKSNPYIVMVSTPNAPDGLFERIEKEAEGTCLYKRIFLDYTYGIGKIYSQEEIEKAKASPSFEREYNLQYLGKIGNVFHTKDIEAAIEKGRKYSPDAIGPSYFTSKSMGIDPAYGSSAFGIVVTQWIDNHIQILHAEEYHRPDYNEMLSVVYGLLSKYDVDKVYIDGANPSFIKSLKLQIGEDADYMPEIHKAKQENRKPNMRIVPVNFNSEHKAMLGHCKMILEQDPGKIAINPDRFDKLITALRTAVDNDGTLDKESTSYNDIFDAFRLALKFYHYEEIS
jgi:hypothetical protein